MNFLRLLSISLFFSWVIFSFFYSKEASPSFFIKGEGLFFESLWEDSLQEEGRLSSFIIFSPNLSFWEGQEVFFSLKNKEGLSFLEARASFLQQDSLSGFILLKDGVSFTSSSLGIEVSGSSFKWNKNYSLLESQDELGSLISFKWPLGKGEASFFSWDLVSNDIHLKAKVKGSLDNEKT